MSAPALDPERPYTPYQRRQVITRLATKRDIDLTAATEVFKAMEFDNPEGIVALVASLPESPKGE